MQKNKIHILSTRPIGQVLIAEAAEENILIEEISFIRTEEIIDTTIVKKIQELCRQNITAVFTSVNAAEAIEKFITHETNWEIFCIGNTTKKIITNLFPEKNILATADNAELLAEEIINDFLIKKVFFFCGDQRREELPAMLKTNNINVEEIVVYKTIETPQALVKQYDGILFFSPSAVQSFFSKNSIGKKTKIFTIGPTTEDAVKSFYHEPVIISEKPGKENLVRLAIKHFSNSKIY